MSRVPEKFAPPHRCPGRPADFRVRLWSRTDPGSGSAFDPELGAVTLIDGLRPEATETVLTKTSRNAFTTTRLDQILTSRGTGRWRSQGSRPSTAVRRLRGWPPTSATRSLRDRGHRHLPDRPSYGRRNGVEPQESLLLRHRDHLDSLVHRAQDVIELRYSQKIPLADLAAEVNVSERTLTRAFARALGTSPLRYQQAIRRDRAEALIAAGAGVEGAALEVGFEDARMLRRLRRSGQRPEDLASM